MAQLKSAIGGAALAVVLAIGVGQDAGMPSAATAAAPALPKAPASGEMGFVISEFHSYTYINDHKVDCPDGFLTVLKDDYLATQTPAERARLKEPANEAELRDKWLAYGRGPNNTNVCSNVNEFMERPPTPMNKGKVAWGFNLDNDETGNGNDPYTCKHVNYASPSGEKGIDHQFWRVRGCSTQYRGQDESGNGEHRTGADDLMGTGQLTQVILLRGVNSLVNDPDVQVVYANTADRPAESSAGKPVYMASYSVSTDGRKQQFRNELHGRIVNGVLTTDIPKRIQLVGSGADFDLDRGKLRLEFQPDGTVKGMVGGYQPLLSILGNARGGGFGTVSQAGYNCAGQYTALRMMADGDKDPKTGKCSRISYTYELFGYPGYVNDVQPKRRVTAR